MPAGRPIPESGYVVFPDTHGFYELVVRVLDNYDLDKVKPIFLGDIIDRGPDSAKLIGLVRSIGALALVGNHEWTLRNALGEPEDHRSRYWCKSRWPGYEKRLLESYGLERTEDWAVNAARLSEVMADNGDLRWLQRLAAILRRGGFYCHSRGTAGICALARAG